MVSAEYLKKYFMYPQKIWHTKAPGKTKTMFELGDLDLIFEVTEVI